MPVRVRQGLWAVGILAGIAIVFAVALPYVASTRIVRDRIAEELSAWSGYRVTLEQAPEIEIWPSFQAHLNDVRFSAWNDVSHTPVLSAERIDLELSALSALRGHIEFSAARMVRPTLRVSEDSGYMPAGAQGGRLKSSIEAARAATADDQASAARPRMPSDAFGTVSINDGRILVARSSGDEEIASGLSGNLEWLALDRPARLTATGIWRGETVELTLAVQQPLMLLSGTTSPLNVTVKAAPITLALDGTASLADQSYFQGEFSFSTPSLRRLLEWSRTTMAASATIGSISLAGDVVGDARRVKIENTELVLDGNPGVGVLEIGLASPVPTIAGTLAFDSLDLRSFLSVFTPLQGSATTIDTVFAERVGLDLRLSASRAKAGTVELTDVAASAQVKEGLAAFDISDARAFGGSLQAGIRFDRLPEGDQAEVRINGTDMDGVALSQALGWTRLVPAAPVTLSVTMKGPAPSWDSFAAAATGNVAAKVGMGSVAGFDITAFRERTAGSGFFPFAEVSNGTLAISGAELQASLANGVARLEKAEVRTERNVISVGGLVPYLGGGLALSGAVMVEQQGDAATAWVPENSFFVGGTWSSPFVYATPKQPPYEH
ncbi:MAG: AsmA-like C-terminal region-containing protein [Rhizobiaceae bacterium]